MQDHNSLKLFECYGLEMLDLNLAKVGVEGSTPFARCSFTTKINSLENRFPAGGADFAVFGFPESGFR